MSAFALILKGEKLSEESFKGNASKQEGCAEVVAATLKA